MKWIRRVLIALAVLVGGLVATAPMHAGDNYSDHSVAGAFVPADRIKAAVIAAPGLAFTCAPDRLNNVSVPVQLWSADMGANVPHASNTRLVREALGPRAEFHPVPGAGHFSFLALCGLLRPPASATIRGTSIARPFTPA